jgi:hypothetical protein
VIISGERQELSRRWGSGGSSRKLRRRRDLSKASDRRLGVPQTRLYIEHICLPRCPSSGMMARLQLRKRPRIHWAVSRSKFKAKTNSK